MTVSLSRRVPLSWAVTKASPLAASDCSWCGGDETENHGFCKPAVRRLLSLAEATEKYADSLGSDPLANVYWGISLGQRQAAEMLAVDSTVTL